MYNNRATLATKGRVAHIYILYLISQITPQRLHILFKSRNTFRCYRARSTGHLALETLFHLDVTGFLQFIQLHTQIAGCRFCLLFNVDKISTLHTYQQGDNRKAQFGVQQRIQLFKHLFL